MRSTARVVSVALAAALVVAACGSDDPGTSEATPSESLAAVDTTVADTSPDTTSPDTTTETTTDTAPDTTAATSTPDEPSQDVEADTAAADAALLTLADLPAGWTESPADEAAAALTARLAECVAVDGDEISAADASAATGLFVAPEGSASIAQHVGVLATETEARTVVAFTVEPAVPACFEAAYAELGADTLTSLLADGAQVGTPTATRLQVGSAGDATQAIRVVAPVTGDPAVTAVTIDTVVVRSGRSLSTVTFTSVGRAHHRRDDRRGDRSRRRAPTRLSQPLEAMSETAVCGGFAHRVGGVVRW